MKSPFDIFRPCLFFGSFFGSVAPCQVGDDISQAVKRFCHFCFSEEAGITMVSCQRWHLCPRPPQVYPPCQIIAAKMEVFMDGTEAQRVYVSSALDRQMLVTQRCANNHEKRMVSVPQNQSVTLLNRTFLFKKHICYSI